ncbi:MAG: MEDS domain-containing protein, partial [Thermoplasmata archaeon]|nr:MEDS domain-containing protein [Thermoplasmata archaeon]
MAEISYKEDKNLRKTDIDVIGDVPWGTHLCQFYQSKQDLLDILVPYFKAGLENNEFCMWVTSEPLRVDDARGSLKKRVRNLDDYIKKGQVEILNYNDWYTKSGKFEADKTLKDWVEKEKQALEKGFDGLRLTGNTFWLEKKDWKGFYEYEEEINRVIGNYRMLAICSYSLDKCNASEVIDVVANHQFALIRREGNWELIESTERKRAEEALRQSESKNRTLLENLPQKIFFKDKNSVYVSCNENYARDLKITP